MSSEKCCGTCGWGTGWTYTNHKKPRIMKQYGGKCSFPQEIVLAHTPDSYRGWRNEPPRVSHHVVYDAGTNCTCWKEKE